MPVIKEVKIKIESSIENLDQSGLPDGEVEKTVSEAVGFIHCFGDEYLITYSERSEGGEVFSEILVKGGGVRVKRKGAIEKARSTSRSTLFPPTSSMRQFSQGVLETVLTRTAECWIYSTI